MLSSLFINLDNYKNEDLKQGRVFNQYEQEVKKYTFERLPYLELTSMPGLTSINEAFNDDDSIMAKNKHVKDNLSQSEAEFNKTLSEYSALQQNLVSSALYHNTDPSVIQNIMVQLSQLNDKLIQQAKNISYEMASIRVDDDTIQKYIKGKQNILNNYISKLDSQRSEMETVDGMRENTRLIRTSNQYHYLMWVIVLITFISLFFYILTSDLVMDTLLVIISLMVIYLLARAINNKYM